MLCYEIRLNGEKLCVIGHEDALTLTAGVMHHRKMEPQFIGLNAITLTDDSKVRECIWNAPQIRAGDEISIKLVESDSPTPPDHELLFAQQQANLVAGKTQCSFCGADESSGMRLFDGSEARICESCIEFRHKILADGKNQSS